MIARESRIVGSGDSSTALAHVRGTRRLVVRSFTLGFVGTADMGNVG